MEEEVPQVNRVDNRKRKETDRTEPAKGIVRRGKKKRRRKKSSGNLTIC
jgi:hypothetical protein